MAKNLSQNPFVIQHQASDVRDAWLPDFKEKINQGSFFITNKHSTLWLGEVISKTKFGALIAVLVFIFAALLFRLFYLQIIKGDEYHALAEGNRIRTEYVLPQRGIIFDRYGKPMVENVSSFSLYLNPFDLNKEKEYKAKLEQFLRALDFNGEKLAGEDVDELMKNQSQLPVMVKENLDYNQAMDLIIKISEYPGLAVAADPRRSYLIAENGASHLLGYTSRINAEEKDYYLQKDYQLIERVGRTGIEEQYQDQLRGELGKKMIEVDSLGQIKKVVAEENSVAGHNLFLAIDADLQNFIALTLKKHLTNKAAAVVALDPASGKVRALISWPTFENNIFSRNLSSEDYQKIVNDPLKPLINRPLAGEYPSGSTVKILIAGAALEEKLITRNSTVLSTGGVWYDKWFFPDWKAGGHGSTNVIKALAQSVNTFFYYLGLENFDNHQGLGLERLLSYFKKFGLGSPLGIDLKGEKGGFLPSVEWKAKEKNEPWYPGDTLHLAIGQGDLLVTPLQIANVTSVVANGGKLYRPQLVEKIINPVNHQETIVKPEVLNYGMVSQENLAIVREGMREGVVSGSGRRLSYLPLEVAGKTGTAQVGGTLTPHAWFTSFGPYQNPSLVLTVLVENGGEGSEVAVPIAQEIWQWYAANRQTKADD